MVWNNIRLFLLNVLNFHYINCVMYTPIWKKFVVMVRVYECLE